MISGTPVLRAVLLALAGHPVSNSDTSRCPSSVFCPMILNPAQPRL